MRIIRDISVLRSGICLSLLLTFILGVTLCSVAAAQTAILNFGGNAEKFKGGGDKEPPMCQLRYPSAAQAPFFIQWNCDDNWAERDNIRTELWIYRKNATAGTLVTSFLGFPASVYIDESILQVGNFIDGMPFGFRLFAEDRAGIATLTPLLTISNQSISFDECDFTIQTEATESEGSTTGQPAMTVNLSNASVSSQQASASQVRVITSSATAASPCEITSICEDSDRISFDSTIIVDDDNSATGSILVSPGSLTANLSGSAETTGAFVTSIDVSGTTTIDGANATITLSCQQ